MTLVRRYLFVFLVVFSIVVAEAPVPDTTIMVPMRDGKELPTDIYLPTPESRGLPCLLVRSPAGRTGPEIPPLASMAQWGYVVAIQDTRSAADPEGKTLPLVADGWGSHKDGYDAVEWLAKSEWTNGKIGTVGNSAQGITQLLLAPTAPKSLACQYIKVACGSMYHHACYSGGQLHKAQVESWLSYVAKDPSVIDHLLSQPEYNDFWAQFNSMSVAESVEVPAIHVGGWYDIFLQGTIDGYSARMNKGKNSNQKLVVGPWTHFWPMDQRLGDFMVPDAAKQVPEALSSKAWFDHHLKGEKNAAAETAPVTYFVMGSFEEGSTVGNTWKTADAWPVPSTPTPLFMSAGGKLLDKPEGNTIASATFKHDPENPVPTIGGRNLFLASGAKDQRPLEEREDVVVFTSEPLTEDMEVTGRVTAKLFLASDADDTDVAVRLCDVYPDGRSILIMDGLTRVKGEQIAGSDPHEVEVDLLSTSVIFAKGHRVRVSIAGSNYPCFEKSLGNKNNPTGTDISTNVIHMGGAYPSSVILPVVKKS